jgi:hypothetical protein
MKRLMEERSNSSRDFLPAKNEQQGNSSSPEMSWMQRNARPTQVVLSAGHPRIIAVKDYLHSGKKQVTLPV